MSFLTEKLEPQRLELFLAKPNKIVIGNLHHIKNERLKLKHGEVNELSFTLPYEVVMRNKLARNPHIDNIREKFFIKMKLGEIEEWFIITKLSKKAESTDDLDVQCFSLGYQLSYQRMIDYVGKSLNCLQVLTDCLKGTSWEVGYINPEFNLKHRQFDVSSKSKLEFLYEIAETFEGIVKFDTINSKINIYKKEEISQHKGFWIEEGKYLENIESITDADEIVTRLFVKGSDNLTINSVNPTGQSYVDDFSYFLSPFEMDEDGNIISHSDFMSDELCIGIINYNKVASSLKGEFAKLLDEKKSIQLRKTEAENKLNQLNHELTLILDRLNVAKKLGEDTSQITLEIDKKQSEIKNQKQLIESINKSIESVDKKIEDLKHQLNIENHLSEKLLSELTNFIQVFEWSDDNQIDPNDLYEESLKHIKTVNSPPINMKVNIVNFFEMVTESHNWNRLNVGDIVKIKHKKLNIWVTAKIIELEFDFENATIDISISNVKEIETAKKKIERLFYTVDKVDTDYNARKTDWIKMTHNYNLRNDRIKETPVNPHSLSVSHEENDDGSASLNVSWSYPNYNQTEKNEDNIDGFIVYLYSDVDDTPYIFGSRMANETVIPEIHYETRAYTFPSVPGNRYYTLGVRAYRRVDPDINSDQIIFSDIVSLDKPYLPTTKINFKGKINGSSYTVASEENKPKDPDEGDIWVNTDDAKVYVRKNNDWKVDNSLKESKDYTDKIIGERESEIRKEVEEALKEVDEAMERVDSEMERIQNEVIPDVERAIRETYIPRQPYPPDEIGSGLWWDTSVEPARLMRYDNLTGKWVPVGPTQEELDEITREVDNALKEVDEAMERVNSEMDRIENEVVPEIEQALKDSYIPRQDTPPDPADYKLWWDTSVEPPRFMQFDETKLEWVPVAPTEDEINQIIDDMRNSVVAETREYTEEEIRAVKQLLLDDLSNRIGNVNARISDLNTVAEGLKSRADSTDLILSEQGGKINTIETTVDEVKGQLSTTITNIEAIDGVVQSHSATLLAQADLIAAKVDDLTYQRDKSGILSSIEANTTELSLVAEGLSARVTKEEFDSEINGVKDRLSTTEATLTVQAGLIEAKAEKNEVYTRTQTDGLLDNKVDTTVYNNKVGELITSIDNVTARVSNTETSIDTLTGNMTSALSQIASLDVRADGIVQSVSEVRADLDGLEIGGRNYVRNSAFISDLEQWASWGVASREIVTINNKKWINIRQADSESFRGISQAIRHFEKNTDYTISFTAFKKDASSAGVRVIVHQNGDGSNNPQFNRQFSEVTTEPKRYSYTFKSSNLDKSSFNFMIGGEGNKPFDIFITDIQFEKGSRPSDHELAPEDTDARITSAEASIKTLAGQIELKASQTEVDSIEGRMTAAESRINVLPNEIDLRVTQGIADLEIGGRNLARNTKTKNFITYQNGAIQIIDDGHIRATNTGPNGAIFGFQQTSSERKMEIIEGEKYTISFDVRGTVKSMEYVYIMRPDAGNSQMFPAMTVSSDTEFIRVSSTFTSNRGSNNAYLMISTRNEVSGAWFEVKNIKLEKGSKATDWSPAPEDQVNKTNVLSSINLSNEGVKIQGSKIDIAGLVSVLNADGSAGTLINGNKIVTGSLTANRLNVNEIFGNSAVIAKIQSDSVLTANLDATKITTGTLNAANVSIINLSATSITGGTLDASKATISNINASNITTGTLNAARIGATSITSAKLNVTEIFGNSAVIAKIQSDSVLTANLSATKITTGTLNANLVSVVNLSASSIVSGTLDAAKVNVANLNASNIKSGTLTAIDISGVNIYGSRIMSSDGSTEMDISGGNIRLRQSNGQYVNINPSGLYGYNSGGSMRFQADSSLVTSAALGTNNENVYLASNNEARVVHYNSIPGDGQVGSYTYLPIRASAFYGNSLNGNAALGGDNIYLRPRDGGEVRVTAAGTTNIYYNFRAGRVYSDAYITRQTNAYIGVDSELRIVNKNLGDVYRDVRGLGFIGERVGLGTHINGSNFYVQPALNGEVQITDRSGNGTYRPIRASSFPSGSMAEFKQDIKVWEESALDLINDSIIYDYMLKVDVENGNMRRRQGLVIGNDYKTPSGVIDGDGVEQYLMNSWSWKAIQELDIKITGAEDDIEWLKVENQYLKQKIQQLENKISEL